jgi:imidazolonepropionase-like amidohydrolase
MSNTENSVDPVNGRATLTRMARCAALVTSLAVIGAGPRTPSFAITHVTVLDGRGSSSRPNGTVIVDEGIIAAVRTGQPPRTYAVVDGHDGYLVPGFIDMHAHLMFPRCAPFADGSVFDHAVSERMLSTLLDFGITMVRSPATPTIEGLRLRDDLNAGRIRGPRAMASAELINDPSLTDQQLRQYVREALSSKPNYFKVYARLSPRQVAAVIDEAHAHAVPVIGHLGQTSWLEAARLGIDYLTHAADWSATTLPERKRDAYAAAVRTRGAIRARIDWLEMLELQSPPVLETIGEIVRRGIWIDPTLVAYDTKFAAPDGGRYRANRYAGLVPEMLSDWIACTRITEDWTGDDYRRWNAAYPKMQALVRLLRDNGVLLTTGTDVTNPWVIPGESLHQEFELLRDAGLAPSEILRMTGENAAHALRRSDVGVIEPGRRADLVLLDADPSTDIRNTRRIVWVMQEGRIVSKGPGGLKADAHEGHARRER